MQVLIAFNVELHFPEKTVYCDIRIQCMEAVISVKTAINVSIVKITSNDTSKNARGSYSIALDVSENSLQ